ncbi:MAG: response regulator [Deltaproteobacteria bacterium]|nr:response regulator [Deltaproteobacteria bacterium]TLN03145.1 MAG: response regulator [bacterium]
MTETVRILFIDDETNILRALERVFLDEEYEILTAGSAGEALEILASVSPVQVVVSDYRMPLMNGVELLRTVREKWPETIRAILSGYADTEAVVSAINDGQIYRFIPKPWNDTELRMTIAAALKQYQRLRKEILYAENMQKKIDDLEKENSFLVQRIAFADDGGACREILDNLPVGVVVLDRNMKVIQSNEAARALLQTAAAEETSTAAGANLPGCLREFLEIAVPGSAQGRRLLFGTIPVLVHAALLETRSSDTLLLAVLTRETADA